MPRNNRKPQRQRKPSSTRVDPAVDRRIKDALLALRQNEPGHPRFAATP